MPCLLLESRALATGTLALLLVLAGSCRPARTVRVTTEHDGRPGSLRSAIAQVNRLMPDSRKPAIIELPAGTYELTRCGSDDTNDAGDLDVLGDVPLTLLAKSTPVVIRQTCAGERVLDAHTAALLTLNGVTLSGGSLTAIEASEPAEGGALRAAGDVSLMNVAVTGNSVTGAPGVGSPTPGDVIPGGVARGGGVFVGGSLTAVATAFTSNTVTGGAGGDSPTAEGVASTGGAAEGGALYVKGAVHISGGSLAENRAAGGKGGTGATVPAPGGAARGGGLAQDAASTSVVNLEGAAFTDNAALGGTSGSGGSTTSPPTISGQANALGGAVAAAGALTAERAHVVRNRATGGTSVDCVNCPASTARGGAFDAAASTSVTDGTFDANEVAGGSHRQCQSTSVPNPAYDWNMCRPYLCAISPTVCPPHCYTVPPYISALVCSLQGPLPTHGAAIACDSYLRLVRGRYTRNLADQGAVITTPGQVTIQGGEYTGNARTVLETGADAAVIDAEFHGNDGSYLPTMNIGGKLTVANSRFADNSSGISAFTIEGDRLSVSNNIGGVQADEISLKNSSVIGNGSGILGRTRVRGENVTVADHGSFGIWVNGDVGELTLINATITRNALTLGAKTIHLDHVTIVDSGAEGASALDAESLTTHRSVVIAPSTRTVCNPGVRTQSSSYNWFSDASCGLAGAGDRQSDADFALLPLADNGGPVQTRSPAATSVLIDQVPASACPLLSDARGVTRPQDGACDIGAVELER